MEPFVLDLDPADPEDSDRLEDVRAVFALPPKARATILNNLGDLLGRASERAGAIVDEIVAGEGVPYSRFERSRRCVEALLLELGDADEGVSVGEWVGAWERALPAQDFPWFDPSTFRDIVRSLIAFSRTPGGQDALLEYAKQRAAIGVLPSFMGVETTVDARAVISGRQSGPSDGDYSPKVLAVTPVITVSISVNRPTIDAFAFQLDVDELEDLRSALDNAARDASALIQFIRSSRSPGETE